MHGTGKYEKTVYGQKKVEILLSFGHTLIFMIVLLIPCVLSSAGNPWNLFEGWRKPVYMENMDTDDIPCCNILSKHNVKYI